MRCPCTFAAKFVVTDAELFAVLRSGVVDVTNDVFVTDVIPVATWTVSVNVAFAPLARIAALQVTVAPESLHPGDAETNVSPLGSVSVTVTPLAALGPAFVTTSV